MNMVDLSILDPTLSGVISGVTTEILIKFIDDIRNNQPSKIKISDAYFKERYVSESMKLQLKGETITPEDRKVQGKHVTTSHYLYAELGSLLFSIEGKFRRIRGVSLIHSSDDSEETVDDYENIKRELQFEKLQKSSRSGDVKFKSNCQLTYSSYSNFRIKNFLVCVDAGKKGFDVFVLQTLQSPIGKYHTEFVVGEEGDIVSLQTQCQFLEKKFRVKHRIVLLNKLEEMVNPFMIANEKVYPGNSTKEFMEFVKNFISAYNLGIIGD